MESMQDLRDRVEELETLMGMHSNVRHILRLSGTEERIVGILIKRQIVSVESLLTALYGGLTDRTPNAIAVHIMNIRRKIAPWGITVRNRWGEGYYLDAEARAVLKEVTA